MTAGAGTRVLVTNDDGVRAPGLAALARAAVDAGFDVVVAAPVRDQSGTSAAIAPVAAAEGFAMVDVELDGAAAIDAHGVDGPPALAVITARLGGLGPAPDLVASGINNGPNTGFAVLHSGTVGAALTAANFGVSALAVSIAASSPRHLETAAVVAGVALGWLAGAPARTVLNVNVPDVTLGGLAGVRAAPLASFGDVQATVEEGDGGQLRIHMGPDRPAPENDTDTALLAAGFVTVTSLVGVHATDERGASAAIGGLLAGIA